MAKGDNMGQGFPPGTCPDSDHISAERSRLKQASQRHFAQNAQQAAPPKQKQATGGKASTPPEPTPGAPPDLDDEM